MRAFVTLNLRLTFIFLLLPLLGSGCVTRTLLIETEPQGAEVILNGQKMGTTPIEIPFRHYGVYRVELSHKDTDRMITQLHLEAPWYSRFPLGLFSELLWPGVIRDRHYVAFKLEKKSPPSREELIKKADTAKTSAK